MAPLVMNFGYVPLEESLDDKLVLIEAFVAALKDMPSWAVMRAFEDWIRTRKRRPAPAEIRILAQDARAPIVKELQRRKAEAEKRAAEHEERQRNRVSAEVAAKILTECGFTAQQLQAVTRWPMAGSAAEALSGGMTSDPHWTEGLDRDDPRMKHLDEIRASDPIIAAARADARKNRDVQS